MPSPRRTPRAAALVATGLALLALVGGCSGDEARDVARTTCGEVRAMSADERLDLLVDLAGTQGGPGEAFGDAEPADQRAMAARLVEGCRDVPDDEPLQQVSAFPTPTATPTPTP